MTNEQRYLTIKEAAEYLRLAPTTLYHWIKKGKLSYIKIGERKGKKRDTRAVRLDRLYLDRLMKSRVVEATQAERR